MTEGIDYGPVTEADMVMLKHAMVSGVEETDFSEFYISEE